MTREDRATNLLSEYNNYRRHTHNFQAMASHHPMRDHKMNPEKREAFGDLADWCSEQGIDPSRWVYARFKVSRWLYAPKIKNLVPSKRTSAKALHYYHSLEETPLLAQTTQTRIEATQRAEGKAWVTSQINNTVELRKARYLRLAQSDVCISQINTETYGYNSASKVCQQCPRAHDCFASLAALYPVRSESSIPTAGSRYVC